MNQKGRITMQEYDAIREKGDHRVFQPEPCNICYGDSGDMDLVAIIPSTDQPFKPDFFCTSCVKKIVLQSARNRSELSDYEQKQDFLEFCRDNNVRTLVSPTFNMRGQVVYLGSTEMIPEIASPDNALEKIQGRFEQLMDLTTQEFPCLIGEVQRLSIQKENMDAMIMETRALQKEEEAELNRLKQLKESVDKELRLAETNADQLRKKLREEELPKVFEEVRQELADKEAALVEKEAALEFALQQHYAAIEAEVDAAVAAEKKILDREFRKQVEGLSDREARLAPREARLDKWKSSLDDRETKLKEREGNLSLLGNLLASFSSTAAGK